MRETRRYLGLELAGAKNQKTAVAALEFYPKEKKIFLLDIYDRVASQRGPGEAVHHGRHSTGPLSHTGAYGVTTAGDEALLDLIRELKEDASPGAITLGVNVPLELPPALGGAAKPSAATVAAVKWMRDFTRKAERHARSEGRSDPKAPRVLEFTPYTQRPVELWVRYHVLSPLPEHLRFEIDETLGGNKAPLTARMNFLRRHLEGVPLVEAWPKLTIALLARALELPKRVVQSYRRLEEGIHAREQIIETLSERMGVFVYERDIRKLSQSLPAFDAFVCAYTALLADTKQCAKAPTGFPLASGWVHYPQC